MCVFFLKSTSTLTSCFLNLSQVRLLLASGANPEGPFKGQEAENEDDEGVTSSLGQSPLLIAARWGHLSVVQLCPALFVKSFHQPISFHEPIAFLFSNSTFLFFFHLLLV